MTNYKSVATRLKTPELVAVYNTYSDKSIKKFSDREAAVRRTTEILEFKKPEMKEIKSKISEESCKLLDALPDDRKGKFPGPKSKFQGKKIYKLLKENPRRKKTGWGYQGWDIMKDGMTYEEFRLAGGRTEDLAWDVMKKNVEVK